MPAVGKERSNPTRWTTTLKEMDVKSFAQLGVFLSAHGKMEASQGAQFEDSGSESDDSDSSGDDSSSDDGTGLRVQKKKTEKTVQWDPQYSRAV